MHMIAKMPLVSSDPWSGESASGPSWGLSPQTSIIGSYYQACHAIPYPFSSCWKRGEVAWRAW